MVLMFLQQEQFADTLLFSLYSFYTMPSFPWNHSRRYNTASNYFQQKFGERFQKLSIDAGFTCPNRDGNKSAGGCIYCNNDAFNPSYCNSEKTVTQQLFEGIEFHLKRYRRAKEYFAYFQTYSNTYTPLPVLKEKFNEALQIPEIVGLVISTRPDCLDDEKLEYLSELNKKHIIIVEYGVESCYNTTLQAINRQHTFEESVAAIKKTAAKNIITGAHLIFGLPGESKEQMLAEATLISELPLTSVKLHQLQIIKNTPLALQYSENPSAIKTFELPEYIEFIIDFLEQLNPAIVIERLTAEVPPRFLIAPDWGLLRTDQIMQKIEKRMEERNTWQGRLWKNNNLSKQFK
jgi:uncharacterized protein